MMKTCKNRNLKSYLLNILFLLYKQIIRLLYVRIIIDNGNIPKSYIVTRMLGINKFYIFNSDYYMNKAPEF